MSMLDFSTLKKRFDIRDFIADHLERTPGGGHECPFCGSGTGPKGSGALYGMPDGEHYYCHSCGERGDAFDLAGQVKGLETPSERYSYVEDWLGMRADGADLSTRYAADREPDYGDARQAERDNLAAWRNNIDHPDALAYLEARGISLEIARRHGLGYDPERRRIAIPVPGSDYYHVDRSIDDGADHKYSKPKRDLVGPAPLWNPEALEADHLFAVEGPLDAISVGECGHPAIALCGTGSTLLLRTIRNRGYDGIIYILLDDDDAGHTAAESLAEELEALGVDHRVVSMADVDDDDAGDPADCFEKNPIALRSLLDSSAKSAAKDALELSVEPHRRELAGMGCRSTDGDGDRVIKSPSDSDPVPTGIKSLDSIVEGLPMGLTVIASASSVGKTAACLQICAGLSLAGYTCLYYSLEMGRDALVARVVSHMAYADGGLVIPSGAITSSRRRQLLPPAETAALERAAARFDAEVGGNLFIATPASQPTAEDVADAAEHARAISAAKSSNGVVLVVDYLQLLAPMGGSLSERSAVDASVRKLQRVGQMLNAPVVAISSLNRASYYGEVSLDSLKESGGIEYTADLIIGMQPAGMAAAASKLKSDGAAASIEAAARLAMHKSKCAPVREIELTVLKNRNGEMPSEPVRLDFVPAASTFVDAAADPAGHAAAIALLGGNSSGSAGTAPTNSPKEHCLPPIIPASSITAA